MFLLITNVCFAKIYVGKDDFDGSHWYYTQNEKTPAVFSLENNYRLVTTFNYVFKDNLNPGSKNLVIDYQEDNVYAIGQNLKVKIDNVIWTLTTNSLSSRSNGSVSIVFGLPDNFLQALFTTKNDVIIRFDYNDLSGQYMKEYKLPIKFIQEANTMYTNYK